MSDLLAFPNSWKEVNDTDGPQVFSCAAGVEIIAAMQEKATELVAARRAQKVRKTPSWPRSWANLSLF